MGTILILSTLALLAWTLAVLFSEVVPPGRDEE